MRISEKPPKFFHSARGSNPGPLGCEPSALTVTPQSPTIAIKLTLNNRLTTRTFTSQLINDDRDDVVIAMEKLKRDIVS